MEKMKKSQMPFCGVSQEDIDGCGCFYEVDKNSIN